MGWSHIATLGAVTAALASCGLMPTDNDPGLGGFTAETAFACSLQSEPVAGRGPIDSPPDLSGLETFALLRTSVTEGATAWRLDSDAGQMTGFGRMRPDGRWVVGGWVSDPVEAPTPLLMTVLPDQTVILSLAAGENAHLTYLATCEAGA